MAQCTYNAPSYEDRYIWDTVDRVWRHPDGRTLSVIMSAGNENNEVDIRVVGNWQSGVRFCSLDTENIELASWGTTGVLMYGAPTTKYWIHEDMIEPLNAAVDTIHYFSGVYGNGYGSLRVIGPDGTMRTTPGFNSFHYHGNALDLWWVGWEDAQQGRTVHKAARPCYGEEEVASGKTAYRRLLAVEAGLRKFFGYVLNRKINLHDNHIHVDNGGVDDDGEARCPPALRLLDDVKKPIRRYKQCHYFMQDCIVAFLDEGDEAYPDGDDRDDIDATYVDGVWGSGSRAGYDSLLTAMGLNCLNPVQSLTHYWCLLDYIMMHGFADETAGYYKFANDVPVL